MAEQPPLLWDLCCGTGGGTDAFLARNWRVIGFDIRRHHRYRGLLVEGDLLTLDLGWLPRPDLIVASPPCTEFSKWDQPWWDKALLAEPSLALVERCRQIAADLQVPLVLENVRGAQKWLGQATQHYDSFYLWGDGVPALKASWVRGQKGDRKRTTYSAYHRDPALRARIPEALAGFLADWWRAR